MKRPIGQRVSHIWGDHIGENMSTTVHFYLTFNPHLNVKGDQAYTQAHEFFDYLLQEVRNNKDGYAYWGKIINKNRKSNLQLDNFEKVIVANREKGNSTHLYITDFNNIWVGKVESVHRSIGSDFKTLEFYKDKNVEVWFKLTDFTLLECFAENTANKLAELYIDNEYMDLQIDELSPFTTGIKYPAFVQDLAEEMFFDENDDKEYSHLVLRPNPAIDNTAIATVLKSLHAFCFPENVYAKIPHAARNEIESAEIDMLEYRHHNNSKIAFSYIKALEIVLNDLVIHSIKRAGFGDQFFVNPHTMPPKLFMDRTSADLITVSQFNKNYSIGQLIYFVRKCNEHKNFCFRKVFNGHKPFIRFMTMELSPALEENKILEVRGVLAHNDSGALSDHDAMAVRNIILGVGRKGLIFAALQAFYYTELDDIAKVMGLYGAEQPQNNVNNKQLKIA